MKLPFLARACLALSAVVTTPTFAVTATSLSSFGGIEEPEVIYRPSTNSFSNDSFVNITDQGSGRFRMFLRFRRNDWWDGDRTTTSDDRQRAEVKVLGPRQVNGQTFEYGSTWRTDPAMTVGSRFCHITQVKGYGGGDIGAPLVTTTLRSGGVVNVEYHSSSGADGNARSWSWTPNTWTRSVVRLKVSTSTTGLLQVSVNGGSFSGITNTALYRDGAPEYQPKWGLYRGCDNNQTFGDNYLEHENVTAIEGTSNPTPTAAAPSFSPGGGTYSSAQSVTITTSTSGASIRYTTDGSTPSATVGTVYSGPVSITSSTTLKAIAYGTGLTASSVTTATYTISTSSGGTAWEAESLARTTSGTAAVTESDSAASGGARVTLNATGTGSWMQFTLPNVPAGTYSVRLTYKANNNRGQATFQMDGVGFGGTLDQYASAASFPTATIGTVTFSTTGNRTFRMTVAGKTAASSSYTLSADAISLVPTATSPSWEAESLTRTTSGTSATNDADSSASGGSRVTLNATGTGSWVQFTLPNVPAGTYSLRLTYKTNANRGIATFQVNGAAVGGSLDQYASSSTYPTATIGTVTFSSSGNQTFRMTVSGKNSASTSYTLSADKITLVAQ